ncbi:carbohydrate-binding module family 20 protein [Periconia macrospinosa]|uniref:glucan 1,4-alpha-glucosidase n=1 Tax=Periconia macrospinosa TaxID=97972 RepID=A0A2V1DB87_9PLEO|nr:carbohydrate-binding module family 20 protein [Periconia macrospinosa]
MKLQAALVALVATAAVASPRYHSRDSQIPQPQLARLEQQYSVSIQGVLDNIGGSGSKAPGAADGVIIASPSTQEPNYFYTWTRDAALTMKMIVDEFINGQTSLRDQIRLYVSTQAILQTVSNPSGALGSGRGLGEPKFYSNLTRFNGNWGRPQRDGPALRATALNAYAQFLLNTNDDADREEADIIWDVIENDLKYVAQYWNETGFDLWEEVSGSSFFATAVQHRALVEGVALGKQLGKDVSAYESQAPNILCLLQSYWNGQYITANTNTQAGFSRTGIDAGTVIGVISTYDPKAGCDDSTFQPCSSRALLNLKAYVDAFRDIYTINRNTPADGAVAVGRYAEDIYFEGNPWYLTTLAVAEQLYNAKAQWTGKAIDISETTLPFWQWIYPSAQIGTYPDGSYDAATLLAAVVAAADSYVNKTLQYIPESGALAEQFSRENGTAISARDLTWSYAAFVTMRNARAAALGTGNAVPSWGAPSNPSSPGTCQPGSITGSYAPALRAGAPEGSPTCTVLLYFNLNATTFYGENIYITGNTSELGNFNTHDALGGSALGYTAERPLWNFAAELPANLPVEYQYLRIEPDGTVIPESKNRTLTVQSCSGNNGTVGEQTVEDAWDGPVGTPTPCRSPVGIRASVNGLDNDAMEDVVMCVHCAVCTSVICRREHDLALWRSGASAQVVTVQSRALIKPDPLAPFFFFTRWKGAEPGVGVAWRRRLFLLVFHHRLVGFYNYRIRTAFAFSHFASNPHGSRHETSLRRDLPLGSCDEKPVQEIKRALINLPVHIKKVSFFY